MNINDSHREQLTSIYRAALSAVNGKRCVAQFLRDNPLRGEVYLLAIGKAAAAMTVGAFETLDSQIRQALVITRRGESPLNLPNVKLVQSAHPVPDQRSIEAGRVLINFVKKLPPKANLLCLISGGASSLVEVLPDNVTLAQLQDLNNWLLQSGLPIAEMNALRKRVSCIKGGRLAAMLKRQNVTVLLVSDVKGDNPAEIGSGLMFPPTVKDLSIDMQHYPEHIAKLMRSSPPFPQRDEPCFSRIRYRIVASLDMAMDAARQCAISKGYDVILHPEYLQGDAIEAGEKIAKVIKKSHGQLHLWGGECTVKLPANHGIGGRCQSLALSAAIAMDKQTDWCLLAAGTDGSDGTENIAGACVDSGTLTRARQLFPGSDAARNYLQRADAGSCLQQTNDLIVTGATGTNVTDIILGYAN